MCPSAAFAAGLNPVHYGVHRYTGNSGLLSFFFQGEDGIRFLVRSRGLGDVYKRQPFNFTAIGGNLVCAPAMVGNTVVWKPSDGQLLSAWYTYLLLEEAGVSPGGIYFFSADGPLTGHPLLALSLITNPRRPQAHLRKSRWGCEQ